VGCWFARTPVGQPAAAGDWPGACALFVYAAAFSFAYRALSTGTGALLLFGTVQVSMIAAGLFKGERFRHAADRQASASRWAGWACCWHPASARRRSMRRC
jgi:hypothetical protein